MERTPEHTPDRKFYLILGILFSLLYFFSSTGLFHHFHIALPIFRLPQLFCIIAVLGVIAMLRPLLTPFMLTGFKIYAVLQGLAFVLILTVGFLILHHGGDPLRRESVYTWFPLVLEALTFFAGGVLLMTFWNLWKLRKAELKMPIRIWIAFFALFTGINLLGSVLALWGGGSWHHADHLLGVWRIVMLLFSILTGAVFLRELLEMRKEENAGNGK